jgi:hypothetical protein
VKLSNKIILRPKLGGKGVFMSSSILKLSLCAAVLAGVAGCGGGSSSGPPGCCVANPTTVTYTFTGGAPTALATQIGTGAYTQASLNSGRLTLSIPSGTTDYAVAYSCPGNGIIASNGEFVLEASILDGTSFSRSCGPALTSGTATVQINAAAIPGAAIVIIGDSFFPSAQRWTGATLNLSPQLQTGTHDVPIYVEDTSATVIAVRILRSQTVPGTLNGGNTVTFAASDETVLEPITENNIPTGFSPGGTLVVYETSDESSTLLGIGRQNQYSAMPAAAYESGDYYLFRASANSTTTPTEEVGVETITSTAGAQSFTFPAPWSYAGPTAATLPTFDFAYTGFSGMANVSKISFLEWNQTSILPVTLTVETSANYQNGSTSVTIPDLSGLTGFLAPPASGTTVLWRATVNQGNPTAPPSGPKPFVENVGTYTEP